MRAAFYTLGCKVNQYETQVLMQQFAADGYDIVDSSDAADVYIINSCTVTASGDKKTRQIIHRMKRQSPGAAIALTGCFPQAFPEEAQKLSEVDILVGAGEKKQVLSYVNQFLRDGKRIVKITPHTRDEHFERMKADSFLERTRAFVKIQDGCEHYCAYCIIPYARGFNRSKPLEDLKLELYDLSAKGYKEVVLVGIDLSSYGKDIGCHLVDAVTLACTTDGIERVRLGSLEPLMLTDKNLEILASLPKFCPQFHLSLQSGCDATLKRMNRHYDTAFYRELVARIRTKFDNPSITTDIMVGFPGETEEEFAQSLAFAEEIGFGKVHVFAYSIRPGTRAAKMPDQLTNHQKEERSHRMIEVTERGRAEFLCAQVGKVESVLFETQQPDGTQHGYTKNYTPVFVKSDKDLCGEICDVRITAVQGDGCLAELMSE
ncbi:tRNA (N(6)-L-threonylcarbamoyladenosine(37)-C(2))-methylthiotransferase MtaB [uncultured Negativibacillus sp.]|uniref:tRNA (N(6)-L-threonylcarbamoyladenosine(37)-C(2))- methylthiotransferase MtaB n=1 Tax=uncultured Negativibacillus sp. TaxID=1980696 RepID=UPI0025CDDF00|nr:tRNA (N(6)-L-threonylcarbamoyladenosine(37)-C(2))-methylthiotransferase MtaB [uncultured Negativibacillus sp.]